MYCSLFIKKKRLGKACIKVAHNPIEKKTNQHNKKVEVYL